MPIGLLYVASIFASALLLFLIQPLVARMLLPQYGGTPAVWNTALVFFQCVLVAGYAYAHLSLRALGPRRQLVLQAAVIVLPLLFLPPAASTVSRLADSGRPVQSVMLVLTVLVGLPFFVLASNSSLIQRWYSLSGLVGADRPYRLYAASNFGSMLALLAYPFLVEPVWGLDQQGDLWSIGYLIFAGLTLAVMAYTGRQLGRQLGRSVGQSAVVPGVQSPAGAPESIGATPPSSAGGPDHLDPAADLPPPTRSRRLGWVLRAAIAVSLLLSTTMQITTDVAPVPLLWIAPLALYLLTFIIAFARPAAIPRRGLAVATLVFATLSLAIMLLPGSLIMLELNVGLPLLLLATGALLCHTDIARDPPAPARLTEYYLWISVGGAVGGILNSLVAPVAFDSVAEYPITIGLLVLAALFPPGSVLALPWRDLRRPAAWVLILGMAAAALWSVSNIESAAPASRFAAVLPQLILVLGLLVLWLAERRGEAGGRWAFAYAVVLAAVLVIGGYLKPVHVVDRGRGFFGVLRVIEAGGGRVLYHGAIVHGLQWQDPARRQIPGTYYHPSTPLGRLVVQAPDDATMGLIGLGTGALAALCKPDQAMTFYEIDPLVVRMARDDFSFLADAPCQPEVILGDGRLRLADEPDQTYDRLIVDAFSGDAVPVHLLTAEALALYIQKLDPHGIAAFHVSNRYVDLRPVLASAAAEAGLAGAAIKWSADDTSYRDGARDSDVVALSPDPAVIERLIRTEAGWEPLGPDQGIRWTDNHADLLSVLEW
jgi:hypothetical protein